MQLTVAPDQLEFVFQTESEEPEEMSSKKAPKPSLQFDEDGWPIYRKPTIKAVSERTLRRAIDERTENFQDLWVHRGHEGIPIDAHRVSAARDVAEELRAIADALEQSYVARARMSRCSWEEIGGALGTTRQAAQKRFGGTAAKRSA